MYFPSGSEESVEKLFGFFYKPSRSDCSLSIDFSESGKNQNPQSQPDQIMRVCIPKVVFMEPIH